MARSLNKVQLIGNLTRDPELRYTPQGTAVCTFGLATNRQWKTESGETRDDAEFHRIVAWTQLAEICSKMLKKGTRVYVEGRIQSRDWTGQDGNKRTTVEIVIQDMIALDSRRDASSSDVADTFDDIPEDLDTGDSQPSQPQSKPKQKAQDKPKKKQDKKEEEEEEIPF